MGDTRLVTVRMPVKLLEELELVARQMERSRSYVILRILRESRQVDVAGVVRKDVEAALMRAQEPETEQGQTYSPAVNKAMVRFARKLKEKRAALDPPEVPNRMLTLADLPVSRPEPAVRPCPRCESKDVAVWGTTLHCNKCDRNF